MNYIKKNIITVIILACILSLGYINMSIGLRLYKEGKAARKSGISSESNPYIGNPISAKAWLDGWISESP